MAATSKHHAVIVAALCALTLCVYLPLREAPYVYEDLNGMEEARPPSWSIPGRSLARWSMHGQTEAPTAHAANLGLHLGNGLIFYGVATALIPGPAAVWAVGVWLLHPLNSAAVSYVTARTDLLVTLGTLLAIWAALWQPVRIWMGVVRWVGLLTGLVIAAMSKEIGLIAGALVWMSLLIWRPGDWLTRWGLLYLGVIGIAMRTQPIVNWLTLPPSMGGTMFGWPDFLMLQTAAIWQLLVLAVPSPLWLTGWSIEHDPIAVSDLWRITSAVSAGVAVAIVAIFCRRRRALVTWSGLWVIIALLPRFLFRTNEFVAEYHMYLPMVGISLGLGALSQHMWAQHDEDLLKECSA